MQDLIVIVGIGLGVGLAALALVVALAALRRGRNSALPHPGRRVHNLALPAVPPVHKRHCPVCDFDYDVRISQAALPETYCSAVCEVAALEAMAKQ